MYDFKKLHYLIYTTNLQCYRFNNLKNVSYYLVNALILVQNNIKAP